MAAPSDKTHTKLATNRKAFRDYQILEKHEAGIELRGTEVKAIRHAQISLSGAYARIDEGEILVHNLTIPPYEHGNRYNHEPTRPRRLLFHRREIVRLQAQVERKGCTLVPLGVYLERGWVKVELGVCRGKSQIDKRETLRRKAADLAAARAVARRR